MQYFGHHLQIPVAKAVDLVTRGKRRCKTPCGVPFMMEQLDEERTSILARDEDSSLTAWQYVKSFMDDQNKNDNFDALWAKLKDSVVAARGKQLKLTHTHTSGAANISSTEVMVTKAEMEIYRDGTTMVVPMTRDEALEIATQLITHNA
jgi:hypothetical protein